MKDDRSGTITAILIGVILIISYFVNAYGSLFEKRHAYLYEPSTDNLYRLELSISLSNNIKWKVFNPLYTLRYTEPDFGEYLGKLDDILNEAKLNHKLLIDDFEAWSTKQDIEFDKIVNSLPDTNIHEYQAFEYFIDHSSPSENSLLNKLPVELQTSNNITTNIFVVDAVIVSHSYNFDQPELSLSPEISVVRKALLIKNEVADQLSELIL
jgi:hypothetical protein